MTNTSRAPQGQTLNRRFNGARERFRNSSLPIWCATGSLLAIWAFSPPADASCTLNNPVHNELDNSIEQVVDRQLEIDVASWHQRSELALRQHLNLRIESMIARQLSNELPDVWTEPGATGTTPAIALTPQPFEPPAPLLLAMNSNGCTH